MLGQIAVLALPVALFLLALEHFGVPIKGWVTGVFLILAALIIAFGIA